MALPLTGSSPDDVIGYHLQSHWPGADTDGSYRQWYTPTVTYFIGGTAPVTDGKNGESDGWVAMTQDLIDKAVEAFSIWNELISFIDLVPVVTDDADITFAYSTTTVRGGTYATPETGDLVSNLFYGSYEIVQQDIWMSTDPAVWSELQPGNVVFGGRGFETYLHEIGHTLGLSHPGPYNAGDTPEPTYVDNAEFAQDTTQYTIMSYFGGYNSTVGWIDPAEVGLRSNLFASTPMLYDIYAIQQKYGGDPTTRSGDTIYGYNMLNAGWAFFDFNRNSTPIFTIYDAGGNDTLDTSGYSAGPQRIDLTPGTYSDILGLTDNVAIYFTTLIENAIGGGGDDMITGNGLANTLIGNGGNDTIIGGNGVDTISGGDGDDRLDGSGTGGSTQAEVLTGGAGEDTFVYGQGYALTTVADFTSVSATNSDLIDFSTAPVHSFSELMSKARQVGNDLVFDFGVSAGGVSSSLTLLNVDLDAFDAGMAQFSEDMETPPGDFLLIDNPGFGSLTPYRLVTTALGDGGFVVIDDRLSNYTSQTLTGRRFDDRGIAGETFQINSTPYAGPPASIGSARAVTLANGNFVVVWKSGTPDGLGDHSIRARIFASDGTPLGDDFQVNLSTPYPQPPGTARITFDTLIAQPSGSFTVTWQGYEGPYTDDYPVHFYQRSFGPQGQAGEEVDLGVYDGVPPEPPYLTPLNAPRLLALSQGVSLQYWMDYAPGDSSGNLHAFAQIAGTPHVVQLDTEGFLPGYDFSATQLADGRIVFTWSSGAQLGFTPYIVGGQALILDSDLKGFTRPGTPGDDSLLGGPDNDRLYGLAGNDTLAGGAGPDILDGGEGIDLADYDRSLEGVVVNLANAGAQSDGHAAGDVLVSIENIRGSAYGDTLVGDGADNRIDGSFGEDTITGGGGNDTLIGGRGRGLDAVVFSGRVAEYTMTYDETADSFTIIDSRTGAPDGTDTAGGFELFEFFDDTLTKTELIERIATGPVDDPVVAENDTYALASGETLIVAAPDGLLVNDSAPDGGAVVLGVFNGTEYASSFGGAGVGQISVNPDGSLEFTADPQFSGTTAFLYGVRDVDGSVAEALITFVVTPVLDNDAPANITFSATSVLEDTPQWTTLGLFSATDADGDTLTFSLADDADGQFSLRGRRLVTAQTFDFETEAEHRVTVAVTDGIETLLRDFVISVGDVDEPAVNLAPTSLAFPQVRISENVAIGTSVGLLSAVDPEGGTLRWRLSDDADGAFRLLGRKLVTADAIDFETTPTLTFSAEAIDTSGNVTGSSFTLVVRDVFEPAIAPPDADFFV